MLVFSESSQLLDADFRDFCARPGELLYAFEILKIDQVKIFLSCPEEGPDFTKIENYYRREFQKNRTGSFATQVLYHL